SLAGRLELVERPPAMPVDAFGNEVDRRVDVMALDADQVEALGLAEELGVPGEDVLAPPDDGARVAEGEAALLGELAPQRPRGALACLDTPARSRPPALVGHRVLEAQQEQPIPGVDDERPDCLATHGLEPVVEAAEPAEPLAVRNGRVRRRGRG